MRVGDVRPTISLFSARSAPPSHAPIATPIPIVNTTPATATTSDRTARAGIPTTIPRATPTIGPMSGAMIIAPMMLATEFAMSPAQAMIEARLSRTAKRASLSRSPKS